MLVKEERKGDREKGNEICPFDLRVSSGFLPGCATVFHPRQAFLSYLLSTNIHDSSLLLTLQHIDIASMYRFLKRCVFD